MPTELFLLHAIDRFGAQAVMGKPTLGAGEIRRMLTAESVVNVCRQFERAGDWAQWAIDHPDEYHLYVEAKGLADE